MGKVDFYAEDDERGIKARSVLFFNNRVHVFSAVAVCFTKNS